MITTKQEPSIDMWENPQVNRFSYNDKLEWSWDETRRFQPDYFQRINTTISHSFGNVLEIGCGVGNVTKWLSASNQTNIIMSYDISERCLSQLSSSKFQKVAIKDRLNNIPRSFKTDCLVLTEVIEHLTNEEELDLLSRLSHLLVKGCKFIISVPLGHFPDPTHVREFSKENFIDHIRKLYGDITKIDYSSGYSQIAYGSI